MPGTRPGMTKYYLKSASVLLNDALTAGVFQAGAERVGLVGGRERPDLGAEVDALVAEVGAPDVGATVAEHARVLRLHRLIGRQRLSLGLLRRDLHHIGATGR